MRAPAGPGVHYVSRSKAGSIPTLRSLTPTGSDDGSPLVYLTNCRRCAASPGPPGACNSLLQPLSRNFVIGEALTNVIKHAQARDVSVTAAVCWPVHSPVAGIAVF